MDRHLFFELLRAFVQLDAIPLERAQEHLHHHLQDNLLHHALAEQSTTPPARSWLVGGVTRLTNT